MAATFGTFGGFGKDANVVVLDLKDSGVNHMRLIHICFKRTCVLDIK